MIIVDNNETNSDWLRQGFWDLPYTNLAGFVKSNGLEGAPHEVIETAIRKFMKLPAYKAAPESLVRGFVAFLSGDMVMKEWNEDLHPRDERGRFGSGGGSATKAVTVQELDKQMAAIKREQKKNDETIVSPELTAIIRAQGFDAKPQVVSSESELTGTVMYRGLNTEYMGKVPDGVTGESLAEEFRTGDMRVGMGVFGDGVYFAAEKDLAERFAYGADGAISGRGAMIVGALSSDAKVYELNKDTPDTQVNAAIQKMADQLPRDVFASYVAGSGDMNRVLALNGYDALHVVGGNVREQYVILNRGQMQVVG